MMHSLAYQDLSILLPSHRGYVIPIREVVDCLATGRQGGVSPLQYEIESKLAELEQKGLLRRAKGPLPPRKPLFRLEGKPSLAEFIIQERE